MKKILVFDEPEIVSFIQGVADDRCEVVWASKDENLLPCFQKEKPDLVLMNYEASDCGRFGKLLKEIRAESSKVPIILMSGHDVLSHMPGNVTGCIFKPLDKFFLESTLKKYKVF
jgi:DNA-binding NtrC family response regulator